ncbi:uncharacterized protein TNCV_4238631 [Trichonephila clavipes]|nr:uncharacterized protein TNCV_4238631 [Trichonephila clavipes]
MRGGVAKRMRERLNGTEYLVFLQHVLPELLLRWIKCGEPVTWPAGSPSLNPLEFFFWDHLNSLECETPVGTVEDLTVQIVIASADITSTPDLFAHARQSFLCRCRLCHHLRGHHFE